MIEKRLTNNSNAFINRLYSAWEFEKRNNYDCSVELRQLRKENKELKDEVKLLRATNIEQYEQIQQLLQKIEDKNEYQRVLEAKIRRLKDRIKILEKNEVI